MEFPSTFGVLLFGTSFRAASAHFPLILGECSFVKKNTGAGYESPKKGEYARAEALGVHVVLMLVETFGGLGPALVEELRKGGEGGTRKIDFLLHLGIHYLSKRGLPHGRRIALGSPRLAPAGDPKIREP